MASVFSAKSSTEVVVYLKNNGISDEICDKFEDNEIDGQAFLDLTESDIKFLTPKLGVVKKLFRLKQALTNDASDNSVPSPSGHLSSSFQSDSDLLSPVLSPISPFYRAISPPSAVDTDDTMSIVSSASEMKSKFAIPDSWPPSIMSCIGQSTEEEQKRALGPLVRNEVVRVLATQMFCYDPKPKKEFCTLVAKKLVKKYQFMKDTGEKVSGYGSWEKKLIEKIHNLRSKTKRPLDDGETPKSKCGRPKISQVLTRYPPMRDTEDDDITLDRNKQLLLKELEKERPRKEIILSLARQTYSIRRVAILSESDTTASILLEEFVELKKYYVLEQEMDLILEKKDVSKSALQQWTTVWVPSILQYAETCTGKKVASAITQAKTDYEGDQEKVALSVLCKALLKKSVENAIVYIYEECKLTDDPLDVATREPARSAPRIACFPGEEESQYYIYVESKVLCGTHTFAHALMLWFIAHYVLNLEYCFKVKEVAMFIQEFVFKLPVTSTMKRHKSATYLTVTTDIQNYNVTQ